MQRSTDFNQSIALNLFEWQYCKIREKLIKLYVIAKFSELSAVHFVRSTVLGKIMNVLTMTRFGTRKSILHDLEGDFNI